MSPLKVEMSRSDSGVRMPSPSGEGGFVADEDGRG